MTRTVCSKCGKKVKIEPEGGLYRCPCCISSLTILSGYCASCGNHESILVPENLRSLTRDFREFPRFMVEWPLEFELVEESRKNVHIVNPVRGIALNISPTGLYFHTTAQLSERDWRKLDSGQMKWSINLWPPNFRAPISFFATDKWHNRESLFLGVGVVFESGSDVSALMEFIDEKMS